MEQVITQQTKYHAKKLDLTEVDIDLPDTALHDCIIRNDKIQAYYKSEPEYRSREEFLQILQEKSTSIIL